MSLNAQEMLGTLSQHESEILVSILVNLCIRVFVL